MCAVGANLMGKTTDRMINGALPRISSVSPKSAHRGDTLNVDILGSNTHFSHTSQATFWRTGQAITGQATGITVISTTCSSATTAQARIKISSTAAVGKYNVDVLTGSETPVMLAGGFTVVVRPAISAISPTSLCCGDILTINGNNFGSTRGSSYVSFGTKKATSYPLWSSTKIKVVVPSGCYWTCDVKVTTSGGTSYVKTIKIKPHITAISPTSGKVVAYITIGGTGFGSSKSTSSVKFGTKTAYTSSTSWTNVKLKAMVPSLSKGKTYITVTTRGGTSNKYTFTVK